MSDEHRQYLVHVGTVTKHYPETPVPARRILEDFGFEPAEKYVLERLRDHAATAEYAGDDPVPLDDPEKNRFRAVPIGGGRA